LIFVYLRHIANASYGSTNADRRLQYTIRRYQTAQRDSVNRPISLEAMNCPNFPFVSLAHLLRAIQNGANNLAEIFLFGVAATLILGETYRGSRKTANRRDTVDDKLEDLRDDVDRLQKRWEEEERRLEERANEAEKRCAFSFLRRGDESAADLFHVESRNAELQSIIQAVVDAGMRNGWLAGHLTVASGDEATRGSGGIKNSVTRTLPVLDLTAWETTPTSQGTHVISPPESSSETRTSEFVSESSQDHTPIA